MTISAISSFSASQASNYQNYRQAFGQLANALQSGNLAAAQSAYNTLASSPAAQGSGPFAQALQQIGKALSSNDLDGAQQALSLLQQATAGAWSSSPPPRGCIQPEQYGYERPQRRYRNRQYRYPGHSDLRFRQQGRHNDVIAERSVATIR